MKRLIFSLIVSNLLSLVVVAQTPKPTPRPPAASPSPSSSAPTGGTGAEGKLAVINFDQFQEGISELKARLDALNTEFEPKRKEVKVMEDELMNLKNQIETKGSTVTPQVRNQWVEEATEKERLYKRKVEDYQQLGQKRQAEVSQPVSDKIFKFLETYCQQHGIALVLEAGQAYETRVLAWSASAADITGDFMKEYNKANPAGGK